MMIGENNDDDSDGDGGTGDEMYTDDYVILMAGMMLLTLNKFISHIDSAILLNSIFSSLHLIFKPQPCTLSLDWRPFSSP